MQNERYPGERRGLTLFLEDLLPAVARACGTDHLLHHAAVRALRSGDLGRLRHARQIFNHLPRGDRQLLSAAIVAAGRAAERRSVPAGRPGSADDPASCVVFETAEGGRPQQPALIRLVATTSSPEAVRVAVRPGTLPSVAAEGLRRIANLIETDRRLLSLAFWRRDAADTVADHRDRR